MNLEQEMINVALEFIKEKNYTPTTKQFAERLGVEPIQINKIKLDKNSQYAKFIKIRQRYTNFDDEKKEGFKSFKDFYEWYLQQSDKCFYCGTTQDELTLLFDDELISSKKFNATLHIERKSSTKKYNADNCVLACALCNNAKSDMINATNFTQYFGGENGKMREFIQDLLSGKITNKDA